VSTTACHQNLSWSRWILFTPNSFQFHCNIILPSRVLGIFTLNLASISHSSCVCYMSSPSHHPSIGFHNTWNTSNQPTSTPFYCPRTGTSSPQYHHKGSKSEISAFAKLFRACGQNWAQNL
jgi:hypothetical protein